MQSTKSELCEFFYFIEPNKGQDGAAVAGHVIVKLHALTRKELVTGYGDHVKIFLRYCKKREK